MKKIQYLIRNYFGFSKKETKGTVLLIALMVVFAMLPFAFDLFYEVELDGNTKDSKELDSLVALMKRNSPEDYYKNKYENTNSFPKKYYNKKKHRSKKYLAQLFPFDPNSTSLENWKKLGVRMYLAKRINKYLAKGGRFKKKEDLKKIYGFSEKVYERLAPYIILQSSQNEENRDKDIEKFAEKKKQAEEDYFEPFDINTADTEQLKTIRGIGDTYASRIVKFRNILGGFASVEQFEDVYGIKPEMVKALKKHTVIDLSTIKKITINTASLRKLKAHPYISHDLAVEILHHRSKYGKFENQDDLSRLKLLNTIEIQNLAPYLSFVEN